MIPEQIIDEVRARADIVEVVGEQISLKRAGKDFKALCPFHHEKTPSFYVVPAKGFYKCFGCGETGDVFSFLMKRAGLSFSDAVRELAAKVGVDIPDTRRGEGEEPHRKLYEAIAFATEYFSERLWDAAVGERARKYLEGRGIGEDVARRFGLGYAPDEWRLLRTEAHRHGIDDAVLLDAGLIKESERGEEPYDRFRDRIIFPIAELGGRVVAFGGRILKASERAPKYLNSPETPIYHKGQMLYGLNWSKASIRREGAALVVEGYMDYVSLAARGIDHVVAGLGTAMTEEQANLVARYCGRALLLYDSDTAGLRATFRTADALLRAGVHPLVVTFPPGEDPDSIARQGGAEALRPFLRDAVDVVERKISMLEEHGFFRDIEGVRRALDRLLPTIRATVDPALRDIYISRISERTGVRRETLEGEASAQRESSRAVPESREPAQLEKRKSIRAGFAEERMLALLLVKNPTSILEGMREQLGALELHDPRYRALLQWVLKGNSLESSPPATRDLAAELQADPVDISDASRMLEDAVAVLRRRALQVQADHLRNQMRDLPEDRREAVLRQQMAVKSQILELNKLLKRSTTFWSRLQDSPQAPND